MFGLWERKGKSGEPLPEANDGPPDSHRPSGLCPRCDKQSSFETTGHLPITFDGGTAHLSDGEPYATFDERATGFLCRHCRQGFVVVESEWRAERSCVKIRITMAPLPGGAITGGRFPVQWCMTACRRRSAARSTRRASVSRLIARGQGQQWRAPRSKAL